MSAGGDLGAGSELLGFRVQRLLGRGGMGVVYLAEQRSLNRLVALKLLAPSLAADREFRERFLRESKLAASLDHPNIVPVFDAGEADGRLYIAMRYVEGTDLRQLLDRDAPLAPERTVAVLAPVADALDAAHARGLVHRDVKPSNILVDQHDRPYLADFGLSRVSAEGGLVEPSHFAASLDYVAPEQIARAPVGSPADVYALGCVLFECLTGGPPYRRDTPFATLFAHLEDPPPTTGGPIDPVLARALAKDPGERYPSCRELIVDTRQALGVRERQIVRDRRPLLLAAIGIALALAASLAAFLLSRDSGPRKPSTRPTLTPAGDSLQRIDPATNTLVATIPVSPNPVSITAGAGHVWVGSSEDQSVLRIDPRTNEITGRASIDAPKGLAVGWGRVHVAAFGSAAWVDPDTLSVSTSRVGSEELVLGVAVGEGALWAVGVDVWRLNRTGDPVATLENVGYEPTAIAVGEGAVWVLDPPLRSVWRIDPTGSRVVSRIRLGFDPGWIAAGQGAVWVTNSDGDAVAAIDPASDRVVRSIPVGDGPVGVAVGERAVWVANYRDGTVSRIDPRRQAVVATTRVGRYPAILAAGAGAVWAVVRRA